jgi:hypothetical protein
MDKACSTHWRNYKPILECCLEDNIKTDLREIMCDSLDWRELVQDKVQGGFWNMVMNLSDPHKHYNFLTTRLTTGCSKRSHIIDYIIINETYQVRLMILQKLYLYSFLLIFVKLRQIAMKSHESEQHYEHVLGVGISPGFFFTRLSQRPSSSHSIISNAICFSEEREF